MNHNMVIIKVFTRMLFTKMLRLIRLLSVLLFSFVCVTQTHSDTSNSPTPEQIYMGISPDLLPELAHTGPHTVGVKTIVFANPKQLNITTQALEDRKLTLEVWYPANKDENRKRAHYKNVTRSHKPFMIQGNAYRNAAFVQNKNTTDKKFPLVVLSHGYTGYRTLMFYLGEHLASHGFVVASIDHTDSTNADIDINNSPFSGFPSTLYNRSRDQQSALNFLTKTNKPLSRIIDHKRAGLVGYSMGGFGALSTIGGCYSFNNASVATFFAVQDKTTQETIAKLLNSCAGGQYKNVSVDKRWKAAVAISPWGNQQQLFDKESIEDISVPTLFIAGDYDDISHYDSIKTLFKHIGTKHSYFLTYQNARHNVAAHPAPRAARSNEIDFGHYWEPTWNAEQINAVNKHFVLAMMNCHMKKQHKSCDFLNLSKSSTQTVEGGKLSNPWKGFPNRFSTGMLWEKK